MGYPWQIKKRPSTPWQRRLDALVLLAAALGIIAAAGVAFVADYLVGVAFGLPADSSWRRIAFMVVFAPLGLCILRWGFHLSERIARGHFDPPPTGRREDSVASSEAGR